MTQDILFNESFFFFSFSKLNIVAFPGIEAGQNARPRQQREFQ